MAIQKQTAAGVAAAPPSEQLVSMNPESFTAGGLLDDADVTFTDVMACEYDYNGAAPLGPSLAIEMTDAAGAQHVQYFSAGKAEDWKPSKDGRGFVPQSGKTGINNSTNLGKLLMSLATAGFPMEQLGGGDLKVLMGLQCHVVQEVQERKGLVRRGKNADRPSTALIVSKINALPGAAPVAVAASKAAVSGKANGAAKTPPPAQAQAAAPDVGAGAGAGAGDDVRTKIAELAVDVVVMGEAPEGFEVNDEHVVPKKDFLKMVFATFKKAQGSTPALCNQAVNLAGNQEFLKSLAESGVVYDGVNLKPAE